ncbi:MAG TPA: hypothetical protein VHL09_17615 [Dehalococcoidia bacterium]|nr:hypothetical protein [Dehalococcoidia bacterium]
MTVRRLIATLSLLALLVVPLVRGGVAQAQAADWAIPNGHFYTQASGQAGSSAGYAVVDDDAARFWSEFRRLGGVDGVGYPVSQRFVWDGFVSQAFQKGVFQWRPEVGQVYFVNVFDQMSEAGLDPFLLTVRQVPGIADWSSDTGRPFDEVIAAHQALLDANPAIRDAYFAVPDPVNLYGLPMAPIENMGNVLVLRAQRVVIQQWLVNVPWAAAGQVTVANGGDVAKEAGLLPAEAIVPVTYTPGQGQPLTGLPAASPNPAGGTTPAGQPSINPRELRLAFSFDNPNPPAGGQVTVRATVTDEVGRPVRGAVVAVIAETEPNDYANFAPHTDASGQTSLAVPLPASMAGRSVRFVVTAIYAELGITQEGLVTLRQPG